VDNRIVHAFGPECWVISDGFQPDKETWTKIAQGWDDDLSRGSVPAGFFIEYPSRSRKPAVPVDRAQPNPLPELTSERLIERIAEAMQIAIEPAKMGSFPPWVQRVMRILKQQFIPREFEAILLVGESVFAEGVAVAWVSRGRDLLQTSDANDGRFARQLVTRLATAANVGDVVARVETGELTASPDFQRHVMSRLFAADFAERRAFAEGLAIGHRFHELLEQQAKRSTTDATVIYVMLWLYWPEIGKLRSIGEVAHALEPFFKRNRNLAGANWEERIRKLANRIRLSFRAKQRRRRTAR
jgi:hypothetical protein